MNRTSHNAINKKPFRKKNPNTVFYCPLCSTQRSLRYSAKLSSRQYLQIFSIGLILFLATFQVMEIRAFIWFFIVWGFYEMINKFLFRKEIPCPHCGFDATWYKRDVRVAKRLVKEFWEKKDLPAQDAEEVADGLDGDLDTARIPGSIEPEPWQEEAR